MLSGMKKIYLVIIFALMLSSLVYGQKTVVNQMSTSPEVGVVENESYIKFNFQKHHLENKTDYNITFFETAISRSSTVSLEFWGHGKKILSLLGPITVNMEGQEIADFTNKLKEHYLDFQKNVRMKSKSNEHSDRLIFDDNEVIFSCYMNDKTAEYAFWINKRKYKMDEKSLALLFFRLESYFQN